MDTSSESFQSKLEMSLFRFWISHGAWLIFCQCQGYMQEVPGQTCTVLKCFVIVFVRYFFKTLWSE